MTIEEPERGKLTGWYKIAVGTSREASVPLMGLVNYTKADCPSFSFCVSMGAIGGGTVLAQHSTWAESYSTPKTLFSVLALVFAHEVKGCPNRAGQS